MLWPGFNTEYGYIIRFEYDGTVPISYVQQCSRFYKEEHQSRRGQGFIR